MRHKNFLVRENMVPMLRVAIDAARKAGDIIIQSADRVHDLTIETKAVNDFVSEVDRAAEEKVIQVIHKAYPNHSILAEESGSQGQDSEFQWIIDPLDGTTNFLHGVPQYAVSIALKKGDKLEVGVVYDPIKNELFTASRGNGAQLNNQRIRVSGRRGLEGALLGTGFPFRDVSYLDTYLNTMRAFMPITAGIRRPGSAALDLAYVAAGRYDGYWELNLSPWDIAAGILLVQEAGGIVTDCGGRDRYLNSGNVVAGSPRVYEGMMKVLKESLAEEWQR